MKIIRSLNPSIEAGKKLESVLADNRNQPVLLMLSGGSVFEILDNIDADVLSSNLTLTALDERFSEDPKVNNFSQLKQTHFFKSGLEMGVEFISTEVLASETSDQLKERWLKALINWKNSHHNGLVIATMGIGNDGHTAGIFGGDYGVDFDSKDWLVAYSVPKEVNEFTNRITVTNNFLKNVVDQAIVYAVGDKKRDLINKLISDSITKTKMFPAEVVKEMSLVTIYTNQN